MKLTRKALQSVLHYAPESGVFTWHNRGSAGGASRFNGRVAGNIDTWGHRQITIWGVTYLAHRLAWFYMTGRWPRPTVDHRNGLTDDNRFDNLRLATFAEQQRNKGVRRNNKCGVKGVCWHKGQQKWVASIRAEGRSLHLGTFKTKEDAGRAYAAAARQYHGEFARVA